MQQTRERVEQTFIVERRAESVARDGIILRATIHRPATADRVPVVLVRNPYGEPMTRGVPVQPFLAAGFAVVVQDCRGCGESDGDFVPFERESQDSVDAVNWCAAQEWSDGRVVMYGASYSGMVQFAAAVERPEALVGLIPIVAPHDYHDGVAYRNGAFQLGQLGGWYTLKSLQTLQHRGAAGKDVSAGFTAFGRYSTRPDAALSHLPLSDAPFLSEVLPSWGTWLSHEERDGYWTSMSYGDKRSTIGIPALHVGGWFDLFLGGTLNNYRELAQRGPTEESRAAQRLVIGPWSHTDQSGTVGELSFGARASAQALGLEAIETAFASAALEGTKDIPGPPVRLFTMGRNVWRDEHEWPLARTEYTAWFLTAEGGLSVQPSAGDRLTSVSYEADPLNPVPTVGGQTLMTGGLDGGVERMPGPRDQRQLDGRADVLRFTSAPLTDEVEVTGPVTATIYLSTTANDIDVTVKLVDVWPDGRAFNVVDGIVRAKFRAGGTVPDPITPGAVHEYTVDLLATSLVFAKGHRIRVDVASSNFPAYDRNPGNGMGPGEAVSSDFLTSHQSIHTESGYPSHILLPVIPTERGGQ